MTDTLPDIGAKGGIIAVIVTGLSYVYTTVLVDTSSPLKTSLFDTLTIALIWSSSEGGVRQITVVLLKYRATGTIISRP